MPVITLSKRRGARLKHVRAIDGLRSVAIVPVVVGHAQGRFLTGGYLGVDIFFVISGFLISSLIIDQACRGSFSLTEFYKRRILRIAPALFVMMWVTAAVGAWLLSPLEYRELGQALAATSVFASNLLFWWKSGYFDPAADLNPLVHTWSLAVEEQFYLLAPAIAWFAVRRERVLAGGLLAIAAASLAYAWWTSRIVPSTYFFFTLNRVWEIAAGALVGMLARNRPYRGGRVTAEAASAVAMLTIALSILLFGPRTHHPGPITLLPVLATGAILYLSEEDTLVTRVLATAPLVWIGLISYSLYLWHQPVLAFARVLVVEPLSPVQLVIAVGLSTVLAWLSYLYIETPMRNYRRFQFRKTASVFLVAAAATFAVGVAIHLTGGVPQRFSGRAYSAVNAPRVAPLDANSSTGTPPLVFWGDSHAEMLERAARRLLPNGQVTLERLGGCPPIPGFDNDWRNSSGPRCSVHNAEALKQLKRLPAGTAIVLAARWSNYLAPPHEVDEFGRVSAQASRSIFPAAWDRWKPFAVDGLVTASLESTVEQLLQYGKRVIVVRPTPVQHQSGQDVVYQVGGSLDKLRQLSISADEYRAQGAEMNRIIDALAARHPGVAIVDPGLTLCTDGRCGLAQGPYLAYRDDNHLNGWGAAKVARQIVAAARSRSAEAKASPG